MKNIRSLLSECSDCSKKNVVSIACTVAIALASGCQYYRPSDFYQNINSQSGQEEHLQTPSITKNQNTNKEFALSFNKTDSLNPYTASSRTNYYLHTLLYDSLIKLDHNYKIEYKIAKDIQISDKICTVKIREDILFSDGSQLTATDVVNTLDFCLQKSTDSKRRLVNIEKYSLTDDPFTLTITLREYDRNFVMLLDFPIIKIGSQDINNPIGSGRYSFENNESPKLIFNPNNAFVENAQIKTINLVTLADNDSNMYAIRFGGISYLFDEQANQKDTDIGGVSNKLTLNNLVYLGINSNAKLMAVPAVRQALSIALNRQNLASNAFSGMASPTALPFNPKFYLIQQLEENPACDKNTANQLLDEAGLTERDEENFRLFENKRATIRIVLNDDNQSKLRTAEIIRSDLEAIGFAVELKTYDFNTYKNTLERMEYELYLAEVKLNNNMDILALLKNNAGLTYGIPKNSTILDRFVELREGTIDYPAFLSNFSEELPFIPLLFRQGNIMFSRNLKNNIRVTERDLFYNIEEWDFVDHSTE